MMPLKTAAAVAVYVDIPNHRIVSAAWNTKAILDTN